MTSASQVRTTRPSLSCVIPAFNESANLPALLASLDRRLDALVDRWEIIVVDDGSHDDTPAVLGPWIAASKVRYVALSRNFGKEAALTAGLDRCRGDVVVLLDADLQHPPALLGEMLDAWRAGADMVYAVRGSRGNESMLKQLGTRWFYRIVNAGSRTPIPPDAGDFRLLDRKVVEALKRLPERNRFMKGLYAWVGFASVSISYEPSARHSGDSSFSLKSLFRLAVTGVTGFTNIPLRLWSGVGAVIALFALAGGAWIVVEYYTTGIVVEGWATLAVSAMFFSGVQLLSIGILGEYVGRIFDEVKHRPIYLVLHDTGEAEAPWPT